MTALSCQRSTTAPEPKPLTRTEWRLELFRINGESSKLFAGQVYTIKFKSDSTCTGSNDCNEFRGHYTLNNDNLSINIIFSTKLACGHESMSWQYLGMLETVKTYSTIEDNLYLSDDSKPILIYAAD